MTIVDNTDGTTTLTRSSTLTGDYNSVVLPTTADKLYAWYRGEETFIQDFFPELNADEREFVLNGITSQEWDSLWGSDDV